LRAAFVLQLDGGDPRSVANFIGKHRARLEKGYGRDGILSIEIQALVRARDITSAKLLLNENTRLNTDHVYHQPEAQPHIDSQHGFDRGFRCNVIMSHRPVLEGEQ
jgi:hypothetical protein